MRWINAIMFYAAAGGVYWYNSNNAGSKMLIPIFPANTVAEADAAGTKTVFLLVVFATLFLIYGVYTLISDKMAKPKE